MKHVRRVLLAFTLATSTACPAPPVTDAGDTGTADANDIAVIVDAGQDVPPTPYDAGPPPSCSVAPFARHIIDRPGGDRAEPPVGLVRTSSRFLAAYHHSTVGPIDGGTDAANPYSDRVEVLALADDGSVSGTSVAYDATSTGERVLGPAFVRAGTGAMAFFDTTLGDPRDPSYDVRLRITRVDAMGVASAASVLRPRYDLPAIDTLANGNLLGVGFAFGAPLDGGVVAARPVSISLGPDGSDLRANDVDLNTIVPTTYSSPHMRGGDDGNGYFVYREGGHVGFLRFDASGALRARSVYSVAGSTLPFIEDVAVVADGIVSVWAEDAAPHTSVNAVVISTDGTYRGRIELDAFDNEGPSEASAVPAYGGVAVLWRRGQGSSAHVRVAVVSPDGTLRMPATDLAMAPGIEGRIVPWASGREIAFIARDGVAPAWGYLFGRACLP